MDTTTQEEILKLRRRVKDLLTLGYMTQESAGTYEQTILQIWQEADRRRQALIQQAETLRRQAAASEAQAGAFTAMASIMYNVINGFAEAGQKRLREESERAAAKAAQLAAETETEEKEPTPVSKRSRAKKV